MNEKITVIVPVYNMAKYLRTCFDSILAQTYKNFELLIVNDGSTDESPAICDEYAEKDPRVRVIHTHNQGQDMARNTALRNVHTDLIAMVDADDCVNCHFLEYLARAMEETDADMVYAHAKNFETDDQIDYMEEKEYHAENVVSFSQEELFTNLCKHYNIGMVVPHKLYRRRVFDGVWYPPVRVNIDEWTVHHLYLNCQKLSCVKIPLYYYRYSPEGMTRNFSLRKISGVKALLDRIETIKGIGREDLLPALYKKFYEKFEDFYLDCRASGLKPQKEYYKLKPQVRKAYRIAISKQTDTFDRKQLFAKKMLGYNCRLYYFLRKLTKIEST